MQTPDGDEKKFCVVVFAAPDDPHELGGILSRVLGCHMTDALQEARTVPGPLRERLSRGVADTLVEEIARIGLRAEAVPAAEVPTFDHVIVVHRAKCDAANLEIDGMHIDERMLVPWKDVEMIAVGQVPLETSRHYVTGEMSTLSAARRTTFKPVDIPLPPGPTAWIVTRNPERAFRIDHKRMNYEYLGDRKTFSATANFRLFIDDVIAHTPHAYLTASTRDFLEHGSVSDYSFATADQLKRDAIVHLLIRRRTTPRLPS